MEDIYIAIFILAACIILWLFIWRRGEFGYKCPHCHTEFKPSSWQDFVGPHAINYKYIRCPNCRKLGWASV